MDRSVPITLAGKDYDLRFEQEDVMACETELGMGYIFFFRIENSLPITLSLKLCRSLIHHGLKKKDTSSDLLYVFPQSDSGATEAGTLIKEHMQSGGSMMDIWIKCREAFEIGWFAKPKPGEEPKPEKKDKKTKNSPGTG